MKTHLILAAAFLSLHCEPVVDTQDSETGSSQTDEFKARGKTEIKELLSSYEQALNGSDADGVVRLYTDDGVLMAQNSPTAVGIQAVKGAYTGLFQAISLNIKFEIAEIQPLSSDWAFMRTSSTGSVKILANGAEVPEGNQELFVLHKVDRQWKIARYSFSTFLPPAP